MNPAGDSQLDDPALFYARLDAVGTGWPVTRLLVALNCTVFLAMVLLGGANPLEPSMEVIVTWGSNFGPLTRSGQWWRLLSCTFIHIGLLHLAVNMWSLYQTGMLVERMFGSLHFLVLYLVAGLAGSLASLLWNPQVISAGASGAVFGIIGGLLAFLVDTRYGVPRRVIQGVRRQVLLVVVLNLAFGFSQPGIDNAAHLGGLTGGLLAGWLLARPLDAAWRDHHRLAGIAATLAASFALLLGGITLLGLHRLSQRQGAVQPAGLLAAADHRQQVAAARLAPAAAAPASYRRSNTAAMP